MQILEGQAGVYASHQGKLLSSNNGTLLEPGNFVATEPNSTAVLQYFDTSAIKLGTQTKVHHLWSRSRREQRDIIGQGRYYLSMLANQIFKQSHAPQPQSVGRMIGLEVLYGKASVTAARQTSPGSVFEIWAPGTVIVVQGTMYTANVDAENGNFIEAIQGTIRVGVLTIDAQQRPVISLVTLKAGDVLAEPPLPKEWRQDPATYSNLMTLMRLIVEDSVEQDRLDVKVDGATLLRSDPENGCAVFAVDGMASLPGVVVAPPPLPPGYIEVNDILAGIPVTVGKTSDIKQVFVPVLRPSVTVMTVKRDNPPAYLSSITGLARPLSIAVDPLNQHVFVTETDGNRVTRCFDSNGKQLFVLAPPGTTPGDRSPSYVAVDARTGIIYISDRTRRVVDMYDVNGIYQGIFPPSKDKGFTWSPLGLTCIDGYLYVTDVTDLKHRVFVFDLLAGEFKLEFGKEGKEIGEFGFPNDAVADSTGRIFVTDSNNFRVQVFDPQGQPQGDFSRWAQPLMGLPRGMDIEGDYLYVVDAFEQNVQVYKVGDAVQRLFTFGKEGYGDGEFNYPNDVALDHNNRVYITDRQNNRVQIWSY